MRQAQARTGEVPAKTEQDEALWHILYLIPVPREEHFASPAKEIAAGDAALDTLCPILIDSVAARHPRYSDIVT